jgi:2-phosphosulfolactate phosphatase
MPRQLNVFPLPQDFEPDDLRGGIAVVIDVLRASTTMVTALANGARSVIPCGDVETARQIAAGYPPGEVLLGGERRGVRIEGFHLDNSPAAYSLERVLGKTIVFTTTNGTAALLRSRAADRVLIGCLLNRRAVVRELAAADRPVHLVCAGTDGIFTNEDFLAAGAIAAELSAGAGEPLECNAHADFASNLWNAPEFWTAGTFSREHLRSELRQSHGGSNLVELGFDADIDFAAQLDCIDLVGQFFPKTADVRPVR